MGNRNHLSSLTTAVDAATTKRRAIQSIMKDPTLSDLDRRLRIQRLMDGSTQPESSMGGAGASGSGIAGLIGGDSAGAASLLSRGNQPPAGDAGVAAASGNGANGSQEDVSCIHYDRKCSVVAPCCGLVVGCRVCHDELSPACGPMDRFAIKEIVCKECNTRQGTSNKCINTQCAVTFAEYHCPKCNLWMALQKEPFHCDECGFCRVGGRENFRHCAECCMCISNSIHAKHSCMTDKYKNNCPVCREDMFSSRQSPQDLPCGHAIHAHCFRNLAGFDYRCPICKKTVVSQESMSAAWQARARDIEMQPMPEDLARVVNIICNDCEGRGRNRDWHFLGVQCTECQSFNTVVEQVVSTAGSSRATPGSNGS